MNRSTLANKGTSLYAQFMTSFFLEETSREITSPKGTLIYLYQVSSGNNGLQYDVLGKSEKLLFV